MLVFQLPKKVEYSKCFVAPSAIQLLGTPGDIYPTVTVFLEAKRNILFFLSCGATAKFN
ncbi:MAG: hypothetical protein AAGK47_02530 [Bacteroidota bacterium]